MASRSDTSSPRKRIGRPKGEAAAAHDAILDAVHGLLQETSVRHLTMEAVAKRAGVGKPTLYKWWPSKAALVFALFHERMTRLPDISAAPTAEGAIRSRVRRVIAEFHGLFGRVMAELIAEGQSDPAVLKDLYGRHIGVRRAHTVADIERAKANGELRPDTDAETLADAIFGPIYYRLLLRIAPFDESWGDQMVDQALAGVRANLTSLVSSREA
jgi:AcrR family transcriptional regulator